MYRKHLASSMKTKELILSKLSQCMSTFIVSMSQMREMRLREGVLLEQDHTDKMSEKPGFGLGAVCS